METVSFLLKIIDGAAVSGTAAALTPPADKSLAEPDSRKDYYGTENSKHNNAGSCTAAHRTDSRLHNDRYSQRGIRW